MNGGLHTSVITSLVLIKQAVELQVYKRGILSLLSSMYITCVKAFEACFRAHERLSKDEIKEYIGIKEGARC